MTFLGHFPDGTMFCCDGKVNFEQRATFIFEIFSPGVDHLQQYELLICIFVFFSFI